MGALIGLQHESYKINRFHLDLERGHQLIIIDSDQLEPIRQALASCSVIDEGAGSPLILPIDQQAASNNAGPFMLQLGAG